MNAGENPLIAIKDAGFGHTPLTVEQAIVWGDWILGEIRECLEASNKREWNSEWLGATKIGEKYGWSYDTALRHLQEGVALGRIRSIGGDKCRSDRGSRLNMLYNVNDVHSFLEWKGGEQ